MPPDETASVLRGAELGRYAFFELLDLRFALRRPVVAEETLRTKHFQDRSLLLGPNSQSAGVHRGQGSADSRSPAVQRQAIGRTTCRDTHVQPTSFSVPRSDRRGPPSQGNSCVPLPPQYNVRPGGDLRGHSERSSSKSKSLPTRGSLGWSRSARTKDGHGPWCARLIWQSQEVIISSAPPTRRDDNPQRSTLGYSWPDGARVAVSLTFDVDAEAALVGAGIDQSTSMSTFSERLFGITRGLQRILALLRTTKLWPLFTSRAIPLSSTRRPSWPFRTAGHEIAHHGYLHRPPNRLDPKSQHEELERGTAILEAVTGGVPRGYRSPSWELTADTFRLLCEMGFDYDSSCMGDDRPYLEHVGDLSLVELPVHWSLDDWPYYSWQSGRGLLSDPAAVGAVWLGEFREALAEGGHVTYTFHPEVSGRRRVAALRQLLEHMSSTGQCGSPLMAR